MEIHQLKTFVAVAREGSITRASEQLYLSQPAVSAHIKAIEETLGLRLFERTPHGMCLTGDGQRLLDKAEQTLAAHRAMLDEASQIRGILSGTLRLGAVSSINADILGRLLMSMAERHPEVDVVLQHGTLGEVLEGIRTGKLDAGFYNEADTPEGLAEIEVARFGIYLAAPPGRIGLSDPLDWSALAALPWICPPANTCCGRAAESLFLQHQIRPARIISIDRETVTRSLIAAGVGVGLLHAETAQEAQRCGEVELVCEARQSVRVLFACLASREQEPLLSAVRAIVTPAAEVFE